MRLVQAFAVFAVVGALAACGDSPPPSAQAPTKDVTSTTAAMPGAPATPAAPAAPAVPAAPAPVK